MPVMQNGQEVMKEHNNYKFVKISNGEAFFEEPNVWASHADEEDIMWDFSIPLDIARQLTYNVSSEGDTDMESQEGGKRKSRRKTRKTRKSRKSKRKTRKSGRKRRTKKYGRKRRTNKRK